MEVGRFEPYLSQLGRRLLLEGPGAQHVRVDGCLLFADVSGFTALAERLSLAGKVGAEELGEQLNLVFAEVLAPARELGGDLVTWGGDAVLLLFDGHGHAVRAARAARAMLAALRRVGRFRTSSGPMTLRLSVGLHSGAVDVFLVGTHHHELFVTGPAATAVTAAELVAGAGEVVCTRGAAAVLGGVATRVDGAGRWLLTGRLPRAGSALVLPDASPVDGQRDDLARGLSPCVAAHVGSGVAEFDHRPVASVFVGFSGVDELLARDGPAVVAEALGRLVDVADAVAQTQGLCVLANDVGADGGKLLLAAGAPVAMGDHERRALSAARSILDAGCPLQLRAGVATGRVFAGEYGPSWRRTYSVLGDSVNLAARLMAKAAPGQVLASAEAVTASRVRYPTTRLGPFTVKGKSTAITAYSIDGLPSSDADADVPADVRADAPTDAEAGLGLGIAGRPMVGRETELGVLRRTWADIRRRGAVVDVVGVSGIGKTRLISEWRHESPGTALLARCDMHTSATPFGVVRTLLRGALAQAGWPVPTATARLRDHLDGEDQQWLPLLGPVLGEGAALPPALATLDPGYRSQRTAQMVLALLDAVLVGPAQLLVADLHDGDTASVELLRRLVPAFPDRPWLLVVSRRPHGADLLDGAPDGIGTRLALAPLADIDAARLVESLTEDAPLAPVIAHQMVARCAGNPLWIGEYVAAIRTGAAELPDSIETAVTRAIDQLPARARMVVRSLSVLGVVIDRNLAAAVLDPEGLEVSPEVLARVSGAIEERYGELVFAHASIRDAAYAGLSFRRRRELHRRAAQAIAARPAASSDSVLSWHLEAAGDWALAAECAHRAGVEAQEAFASAEAATLFARAVHCAGQLPARRDLLVDAALELGRTLLLLAQTAEALDAFALARRRASTPVHRVRALAGLARAHSWRSEYSAQIKAVRAAMAIARSLPGEADPELLDALVELHFQAAYAYLRLGQPARALSWAGRGLNLTGPIQLDSTKRMRAELHRICAEAMETLGAPRDEAVAEAHRALVELDGIDAPRQVANMRNMLGTLAHFAGDLDVATSHYTAALALHRSIGAELEAAWPAMNLVEVLSDLGRWDTAIREARQPIRVLRAARNARATALLTTIVAQSHGRAHRTEQALHLLNEAEADANAIGDRQTCDEVRLRRVEVLLIAGRLAEARHNLGALLATTGRQGRFRPAVLRFHGVLQARSGEPVESALTELRNSVQAARDNSSKLELALSLDALAPLDPSVIPERDQLVSALGIRATPPIWGDCAVPQPAQGRRADVQ